ncbi:hypothetical protein OHB05_37650 [Streptomyces sp. NBC_00638]|uniref:hypothetical protein n=1 Tax=unclassified Streptomyces TaxID=2593676 RepID=UPI002254C969|nr:hypothetical protein [Streptomyces sp. NBC_00638]MCX5008300.1 hypothetical protein [Streptomyces sp. NBC_00638]
MCAARASGGRRQRLGVRIDTDLDRLDQLCDQALAVKGYAVGVPSFGSTVMSSIDCYTTQDILDAEDVVRSQVLARFGGGAVRLTADQAPAALEVFQIAAGYELAAEQRAAVTRVLTARHVMTTRRVSASMTT